MKKSIQIFFLFSLLTAFENAYSQKDPNQTAKEAVTAVLDKFHSGFGSRDTATLRNIITKTGLFCGSSPEEYSNNRDFVLGYLMTDYFADTATVYPVTKRVIQMLSDGNSAIAMELFIYPPRSKKLNTRCNSHLVQINGKWFLDSFCFSYAIPNWDMKKINETIK